MPQTFTTIIQCTCTNRTSYESSLRTKFRMQVNYLRAVTRGSAAKQTTYAADVYHNLTMLLQISNLLLNFFENRIPIASQLLKRSHQRLSSKSKPHCIPSCIFCERFCESMGQSRYAKAPLSNCITRTKFELLKVYTQQPFGFLTSILGHHLAKCCSTS